MPSQWEMVLLCNNVSHWLGASLESSLKSCLDLAVVWPLSPPHCCARGSGILCDCWQSSWQHLPLGVTTVNSGVLGKGFIHQMKVRRIYIRFQHDDLRSNYFGPSYQQRDSHYNSLKKKNYIYLSTVLLNGFQSFWGALKSTDWGSTWQIAWVWQA